MQPFESQFLEFIRREMQTDAAHDEQHVLRVVKSARQLAESEQAELAVVIPAAYLHDCFSFPKNHPQKKKSSQIAADKAITFLRDINYTAEHLDGIHHAIAAHSFSAGIPAQTIEAKVVQDADRLDSIGAVGVARCFITSASLGRPMYALEDPFCEARPADDMLYTIDHFYKKLLLLADSMQTASARAEAFRRTEFMRTYLAQLSSEI